MKATKVRKVRQIFFDLLQDGKPHSTKELRQKILEAGTVDISKPNTIYSIMYQIRNQDGARIGRLENGFYYLIESTPRDEDVAQAAVEDDRPAKTGDRLPLTVAEAIQLWQDTCERINNRLKRADYAMSEEEFARYKRIYSINQKIRAFLAEAETRAME